MVDLSIVSFLYVYQRVKWGDASFSNIRTDKNRSDLSWSQDKTGFDWVHMKISSVTPTLQGLVTNLKKIGLMG